MFSAKPSSPAARYTSFLRKAIATPVVATRVSELVADAANDEAELSGWETIFSYGAITGTVYETKRWIAA
jgi:hypothetical protein